mmetsp:Transcript_24700/g.29843  ORF Transcript_24700/g.29843 Transcript_24700/m.29843 type:complete len:99 (+) Transcript_24700:2523-2819(+)
MYNLTTPEAKLGLTFTYSLATKPNCGCNCNEATRWAGTPPHPPARLHIRAELIALKLVQDMGSHLTYLVFRNDLFTLGVWASGENAFRPTANRLLDIS